MSMMRTGWQLSSILAFSAVLALSGCNGGGNGGGSGGGDGGGDGGTPPTPTTSTTLKGVAMAGPISGQVCAYTLSSGVAGNTALGCANTNPTTGAYNFTVTGASGEVLLRVTGSYTDEATGQTITLGSGNALRSLVNVGQGGGSWNVAITPFTEAAVRAASALGSLSEANFLASLVNMADALGLDATNGQQAYNQLVARLPSLTGDNLLARSYAQMLAIASQAQENYCGNNVNCGFDSYMTYLSQAIANAQGIAGYWGLYQAALADWEAAHPNDGVTCSITNGAFTCVLGDDDDGGNGGGDDGGNGGGVPTGNYTLRLDVTAMGMALPPVFLENVPKPDTQEEFCSPEHYQDFQQSIEGASGSWTINSCSFNGTVGNISATLTITSPMSMTVPYSVVYTYTAQ